VTDAIVATTWDPAWGVGHGDTAFTAERLAQMAAYQGLSFPASVLGPVVAGLRSGKHICLIGPPGTGKTSLAKMVAELGREALLCSGSLPTTATSNWTVADTVGSNYDMGEGTTFRPGVVIDAIETGRWLVIDELNRANLDRALGELFSVLSGQEVVLPFKRSAFGRNLSIVPYGADVPPHTDPIRVPKAWRIIATMNEYDRGLLFGLSHALMRRFAFVRVSSPELSVFEQLVTGPGEVVRRLLPLRELQDLGPAIYVDSADYAAVRKGDGVSESRVLLEAFEAFFLPQFESLEGKRGDRLVEILGQILDPPELAAATAAVERLAN
jgi:DNA replicative helicase MCM subunit Mcm2 (Cdc46/Mcm family)